MERKKIKIFSFKSYLSVIGRIVLGEKCGIDLSDKICSCGNRYSKDGFAVDAINMYPFYRWNEIYVSNGGTEIAKSCMQEYFKGCGEIREIKVTFDESLEEPVTEKINVTKIVILTKELAKKYPDLVITLSPEEYFDMLDEVSVLSIIENEDEHVSRQDLLNTEFTAKQIKEYFNYAAEKGKFDGHEGDMNLGKVISNIENPKFSDLLALYGFVHSTGAWKGNAELLYDKGIPLEELISSREDVYAYVYDKLNGKCCENPSGQVFEIKEAVRKGKYSNNRMPAEIEKLLLECEVPEWYVESMKKILYLFPKTHLIVLLKRDISKFVKMNN